MMMAENSMKISFYFIILPIAVVVVAFEETIMQQPMTHLLQRLILILI